MNRIQSEEYGQRREKERKRAKEENREQAILVTWGVPGRAESSTPFPLNLGFLNLFPTFVPVHCFCQLSLFFDLLARFPLNSLVFSSPLPPPLLQFPCQEGHFATVFNNTPRVFI